MSEGKKILLDIHILEIYFYMYRNIKLLPLSQEISICVHWFPISRFPGRTIVQGQS